MNLIQNARFRTVRSDDDEPVGHGFVTFQAAPGTFRECFRCYQEIAPNKPGYEVRWSNGYRDHAHPPCFQRLTASGHIVLED